MNHACPDVAQRLNLLQGQIYAACRMGAWCFNEEKHLYMSTAPHREQYHLFLQAGGCLDLAISRRDEPGEPILMGGGLGLAWIAEWVNLREGGRFLVILGPAYLKNTSVEDSLQLLDRRGVSQHLRWEYLNVLSDVPVLNHDSLQQYAAMLHFTCYEDVPDRDSLILETGAQINESDAAPKQDEERPENDYRRMVEHEAMLLECLVDGREVKLAENAYQGELLDFHIKDGLRQLKDNLIIYTALCSRTAIREGVPPQTAKPLESQWICRIEAMRSFGETKDLLQKMQCDFGNRIRRNREESNASKMIRECREYIRMNYTKPLSAEALARACGYTEYYLTRKFTKETGVKLTDYIRSVRLHAAKVMLMTSQKDIQRISEELQFGSRSYFDRVFRQEVGMSPKQYRETMGQGNKETP